MSRPQGVGRGGPGGQQGGQEGAWLAAHAGGGELRSQLWSHAVEAAVKAKVATAANDQTAAVFLQRNPSSSGQQRSVSTASYTALVPSKPKRRQRPFSIERQGCTRCAGEVTELREHCRGGGCRFESGMATTTRSLSIVQEPKK
jgi:hypothetical protein